MLHGWLKRKIRICGGDIHGKTRVWNYDGCSSASIDFYWHTLSVKGKGLAYCGVTLVPPCSLKAFIDVIADNSELSELKKLLEKALNNNKWVIHYGL